MIRIHYLKRVGIDDYFFFTAVAALISGSGLYFAFLGPTNLSRTIIDRETLPTPDVIHTIERAATYPVVAELLCWTTIFAIKFSFLFHFRALVSRLSRMEAWWWFIFALLVPTAALAVVASFITCPYVGKDILSIANGLLNIAITLIII